MTNLEKLTKMRESADQSVHLADMLRKQGVSEEQLTIMLEAYQDGMALFDRAIDAYRLMHSLGKFEQLRRDGRPMNAQEREEKAELQRKVDDFAVKLFKAG